MFYESTAQETVESSAEGEGSYQREKDLSMKIKSAVLEVIRQEKRVGGELLVNESDTTWLRSVVLYQWHQNGWCAEC